MKNKIKQNRKDEFSYLRKINDETYKTERQLKEQITKIESDNKSLKYRLNTTKTVVNSEIFGVLIGFPLTNQ
ncbi:hypothetical protein H6G76_07115 [Nostoc sp. FACHB-152]|uniref:hypothetical protein n=1 Tax=Nostoc sp. FACHB-152 TaxID=2692837 RepID=UPI001683A4CB|nr:hypothetical protein [Nostoc sp. FACHB-152]MBD2446937.1 hypothetical protein [Nostoc sp. FACHB-152]